MGFNECVERYAEMSGRTKTEAKTICSEILSLVMGTLLKGDCIDIYGFGKLYVSQLNARTVKGFEGEEIDVPAKKIIRFKTGKSFERRLANAE